MDFIDEIRRHKSHVIKQKEYLLKQKDYLITEEATKTAFINPFLRLLGYKVSDVTEVIPEFIAGPGTKKEDKVDYAIMKEGNPIMIIECKQCGEVLDKHYNQLCQYFAFTKAKIGVLTDGIIYRFYSDIDETNRMDKRYFLEFNILEHADDENLVNELKQFTKDAFDTDKTKIRASSLKYSNEIKSILKKQLVLPTDRFIDYFLGEILPGKSKTKSLRKEFSDPLKKALGGLINDRIKEAFKMAQDSAISDKVTAKESETEKTTTKDDIITNEEEWTSLGIVKSILRGVVDLERVVLKDLRTYCTILLDGRPSKRLLILHMNNPKKMKIGLIGDRNQVKEELKIDRVGDIFNYSDELIERAKFLIK